MSNISQERPFAQISNQQGHKNFILKTKQTPPLKDKEMNTSSKIRSSNRMERAETFIQPSNQEGSKIGYHRNSTRGEIMNTEPLPLQKPPIAKNLITKDRVEFLQGGFPSMIGSQNQGSFNMSPFNTMNGNGTVTEDDRLVKSLKEENLRLRGADKEKSEKLKKLDDENKKLKLQNYKYLSKIKDYQNQIKTLTNLLSQYEETKMDDDFYMNPSNDPRSLMMALRMEGEMGTSIPFDILMENIQMNQANNNAINTDNMSYEQLLELGEKIGNVSRGYDKKAIKKIPKIEFRTVVKDKKGRGEIESCSICFTEYEKLDKIRRLNCSHYYHAKCIGKWLGKEKTCPICKQEVVL